MTESYKSTSNPDQLKWLSNIARLMDRAIKIPGTDIRIGLDPIIGLVPVVGDLISFGISTILLYAAYSNGASGKVIMKMLLNITLDASVGMIPVLGNIFDFAYKANTRNYNLLSEHWQEGKHTGSGVGFIIAGLVLLITFSAAVIFIVWKFMAFLLSVSWQ